MELALRKSLTRARRRRRPPARFIYHMLWAILALGWTARSVVGYLEDHTWWWALDLVLWAALYWWHRFIAVQATLPPYRSEWATLGAVAAMSITSWLLLG